MFEPKSAVYEAAASVAERSGLPQGWLNDAVKGFLEGSDPAAAPVLDLPGLRCLAASPEKLLALKVLAHRVGEDEDDVLLLASHLGLKRADQVLALAERTYGDRLDPAARRPRTRERGREASSDDERVLAGAKQPPTHVFVEQLFQEPN